MTLTPNSEGAKFSISKHFTKKEKDREILFFLVHLLIHLVVLQNDLSLLVERIVLTFITEL